MPRSVPIRRFFHCQFRLAAATGLALLQTNAFASQSTALEPISANQILKSPMHFELNAGQTAKGVDFVSRGPGYTIFLSPEEAVLALQASPARNSSRSAKGDQTKARQTKATHLRMALSGANPHAAVEGLDQLPGTANYFIGSDPAAWHAAIPTFAKVKYKDVYPEVDVIYYGNQRRLEYDFVVHPGGDPRKIALSFAGVDRLEIDKEGGLVAHIPGGQVRWEKPFAYQEIDSIRKQVQAKFVLRKRKQISFQLGEYDRNRPLIIDPVLVYSTYLGGSGGDFAVHLANDTNGNVYVVGDTSSLNFPTRTAYRATPVGMNDVFVTKFNITGSAQVYSTYLGGSSNDFAGGITIDSSGHAFLTGYTESINFPTRNPAYGGNAGFFDIFLTRLGPGGSNLVYSTYLGGNGDDFGRGVAVDSSGSAYVTGRTYSKGTGTGPFPTTQGAYQQNNGGGNTVGADAFITKFTTNGALTYSTFLGGTSEEKANGIAVDTGGNAYVVGEVSMFPEFPNPPSSDFPVVNAFQPQFNQGSTDPLAGNSDGFLTKLNADGSALIFSTFLGGSETENITGIALGPSGRICLSGITGSTNFPVLNAAQAQNGGSFINPDFPGPDAFATVFESSGTSLFYSTYLGGTIDEFGFLLDRFAIAVDRFGLLYLAGQTGSPDFPVTDGADYTNSNAVLDVFVAKINPAVSGPASLIYASLLRGESGIAPGGANNEAAGIGVDTNGNFYVAGITSATNFPVTPGAFRTTNSGGFNDAFVAKFSSPPDLSVTMVASTNSVIVGSNVTYTLRVNNNGRAAFSSVTNTVRFGTNTSFVSVSNTQGGSQTNLTDVATFNIGQLAANASAQQIIVVKYNSGLLNTNIATVTGIETPTLEPNKSNNVAVSTTIIRDVADVTVGQSTSPLTPLVTSNLTYNIGITNKTSAVANEIVLTNVLSPLVTFVSVTNTAGTCTYSNGVVVCNISSLPGNGGGALVTIETIASTAGTATNQASVSAYEVDPFPVNNSSSLPTTIVPMAHLSLGMTAPSNTVYAGNNFTYTLLVTNRGPSTASGVVITNPLPPGATLISATPPGSTNLSGGVLTFSLGNLLSNATATATLTVRFSATGSATNTATVGSAAADPLAADNSASVVTSVIPAADLSVSQLASPSSTPTSSNVTFTVTVTNRGASLATGVTLTNVLPGGLSLVSVQWNGGSWSQQPGGVLLFLGGDMASGSSAVATIVARGFAEGSFTNVASVAGGGDIILSNNTSRATVVITDNPAVPLLYITRSSTNVILSWSTNAQSFVLQTSDSLAPGSVWTDVTDTPVLVGSRWHVTNSIPASGTPMFYRLHKEAPSLSAIGISGNRVVLSWPARAGGSILKSATSLITGNWTPVSPSPVIVGDHYFVTNQASGPQRVYRLYY